MREEEARQLKTGDRIRVEFSANGGRSLPRREYARRAEELGFILTAAEPPIGGYLSVQEIPGLEVHTDEIIKVIAPSASGDDETTVAPDDGWSF